jgi:acyl-CoA thioesterase
MAKAVQNDKVCIVSQASFGVPKKSKINVDNIEQHNMDMPKKSMFLPQIPKLVPKFLQHLDVSLDAGRMPFTGGKDSYIHGWMRFKKAPEKITDAHLITLYNRLDSIPLFIISFTCRISNGKKDFCLGIGEISFYVFFSSSEYDCLGDSDMVFKNSKI